MNEQRDAPRRHSFCYRCANGCIHVVCGHTTLTLKHSDFLKFAEAIDELKVELGQHDSQIESISETCAESLLM